MARGLTPEKMNAGDGHSNEVELPTVRRSADLVIMNAGPIDDVVEEVLRVLILEAVFLHAPQTLAFGSPPRQDGGQVGY